MPPSSTLLQSLYMRTNQGTKLGLDAIRRVLHAYGNPERHLHCVVVAGTNGKGSTSALLAQTLTNAGNAVGLFTSPHLLRFSERIRINGNELDDESFVELTRDIQTYEQKTQTRLSFFEFSTVMAILAFTRAGVDLAIFEVGLGGRLDATNVVPKTLAIITPIGFDHEHILGHTLGAIAREKAGIIPQRGVVLSVPQKDEAGSAIHDEANKRDAQILDYPNAHVQNQTLTVSGGTLPTPLTISKLPRGAYQRLNVTTVAAACAYLQTQGFSYDPKALLYTCAHFQWLGRFQLIAGLPDIILDGAHNPVAINALTDAIEQDPHTKDRSVHTIFAAINTKNSASMLAALEPISTTINLCPTTVPKSLTGSELQAAHPQSALFASVEHALRATQPKAKKDGGLILITGSLFLVADALALLHKERRDPPIAS